MVKLSKKKIFLIVLLLFVLCCGTLRIFDFTREGMTSQESSSNLQALDQDVPNPSECRPGWKKDSSGNCAFVGSDFGLGTQNCAEGQVKDSNGECVLLDNNDVDILGPGGTQQMLGPGGTQQMLGPGGTQQSTTNPSNSLSQLTNNPDMDARIQNALKNEINSITKNLKSTILGNNKLDNQGSNNFPIVNPQRVVSGNQREPSYNSDLFAPKSSLVPPVCPACPTCPREKCPPCPKPQRCPEPAFSCKKVPNYNSTNTQYLPKPVLNDFSTFGF